MKTKALLIMFLGGLAWSHAALSAVTLIPQSALVSTTQYYTEMHGLTLGSALTMTGGGNAANVGGQRNDDGFSGPITFNFTTPFSLFGHNYTTFYANNNGNISFNNGISAYTPTGPQGALAPIISPFFADVDTRNPASGLMYMNQSVANQTIITWDNVGYYSSHADKLDSFQLVVRGSDYVVPAGEGTVGFFWKTMGWETGDASGGTGGFGGTPGAVGWGDGLSNGYVLQGSIQNGISQVVQNHSLWFNINSQGNPVPVSPVPEPETYVMLLAGLAMLAYMLRSKNSWQRLSLS